MDTPSKKKKNRTSVKSFLGLDHLLLNSRRQPSQNPYVDRRAEDILSLSERGSS